MKHHQHAIGWKRANRLDVPLWQDLAAFAVVYAIAIALMIGCVLTLSK